MKYTKRGFTLIELLVVIAIIGILASVVLVSLNSARSKAGDAKIKADLSGVRSAMEIVYSDNQGGYSDGTAAGTALCTQSPFNNATLLAPYWVGKTVACSHNGTVGGKATKYAVAAILPSDSSGKTTWCVDSTGTTTLKTISTANTPSEAITSSACN